MNVSLRALSLLALILSMAHPLEGPVIGRVAFLEWPTIRAEDRQWRDERVVSYFSGEELIGKEAYGLNGKIRSQERYKGGKLDGINHYWSFAGEFLERSVEYSDGLQHGVWIEFSQSGVKVENAFERGSGTRVRKYDDNTIELIEPYKSGVREGQMKKFYPSGSLKQLVLFSRGKIVGDDFVFYESGQLAVWGKHSDQGRLDGLAIHLREDGTISNYGLWEEGVKIWNSAEGGEKPPGKNIPNDEIILRMVKDVTVPRE